LLDKSLEYLSEALPIDGRALFLRTSFNQSLLESLNYLLEACDEVIPAPLFSKATEKLKSLDPALKLSGFLSAAHVDFFNAVEQNNIQKVNNVVEKIIIGDSQIKNEDVVYINIEDIDKYYVPFVKDMFTNELTRDIKFFPLSSQESKKMEYSIQQGLKVLEKNFPDFFAEFQELVSEVLLLKAQGLVQGSSSDIFGMIYKSYMSPWEKITDVLEFIIHEQSHLYVYSLNKDDPLVLNSTDIYDSPIRKEKRPLMGIYHAEFILARVIYVLNKASALNVIPESEKEYCQEFLNKYKKYFFQGLDILNAHAQMTPLGKGLIDSAHKLVA
jgi:hypothetical protein